jgi:hypothetical protein
MIHSSCLLEKDLESGDVLTGHNLIVDGKQNVAFCGVPPADGFAHYQYLDREPIPDVIVEKHIASPSPFIDYLSNHIRREMENCAVRREYHLHRCKTVFLTGVSGSGKTLNILGFIRKAYEVMSRSIGIAMEDLPPRVMRLRGSQIVSKWYGEAERNVDKFFDEIDSLSKTPVVGPDGKEFEAPVIVVAEEIDSLTRERGTSHDAVDDRIQATILQRLDTTNRRLRDSLIVMICTSNVPNLLDPAFVRRAGGTIHHFGRLEKDMFAEVLSKHVNGVPFSGDQSEAIDKLSNWMYKDQKEVASVRYANSRENVKKYKRDFLTGALVERAVQQACSVACEEQEDGTSSPGLTAAMLAGALGEQVHNVVKQLTEGNAHHYMDVPRGSRVAHLELVGETHPTF